MSRRLDDSPGVLHHQWLDDTTLSVTYDIAQLGWESVERLLREAGARPIDTLWTRLRQTRWRSADANAGEYLMAEDWDEAIRRMYVSRYRARPHGRRDDRKHNWREYLRGRG